MKKAICRYCGNEVDQKLLKSHERKCGENPNNKEEVNNEEDVVINIDDDSNDDDIVVSEEIGEEDAEETPEENEDDDNEDGEIDFNKISLISVETKEQIDDEIKIVLNKKSPIQEKNVRVKPKEDHNCCIGGLWYYFRKGVCQNVPTEVKEILASAGKLDPL